MYWAYQFKVLQYGSYGQHSYSCSVFLYINYNLLCIPIHQLQFALYSYTSTTICSVFLYINYNLSNSTIRLECFYFACILSLPSSMKLKCQQMRCYLINVVRVHKLINFLSAKILFWAMLGTIKAKMKSQIHFHCQ